MENTGQKKQAVLLPAWFKKAGVIIIIASIIPSMIIKIMHIIPSPSHKELFRMLPMNGLILGLFFISVSRDKTEDERTISLRLKAMAFSFISAVMNVIITPLFGLLEDGSPLPVTGQQIVLTMLLLYLMFYYLQKMGMLKK